MTVKQSTSKHNEFLNNLIYFTTVHIVDQNVLKIECFVMERFDLTGNLVFLQSFSFVYSQRTVLSSEYMMLTFSCVGGEK